MSTKVHACIDALSNAVRLVATAGQAGDCPQALGLLAGLDPQMVIADTSYDSDATGPTALKRALPSSFPTGPTAPNPSRWTQNITATSTKLSAFSAG